MKLAFCLTTMLFHSVHKNSDNYYTINCLINGNKYGIGNCCIYPPSHSRIPTKDNICKTCFQENKKEIVFLLTKIKLGI